MNAITLMTPVAQVVLSCFTAAGILAAFALGAELWRATSTAIGCWFDRCAEDFGDRERGVRQLSSSDCVSRARGYGGSRTPR